jgi:putative transposase
VKYACIARYRSDAPVRLLCRVLGVSPSGFYAAEQQRQGRRPRSARGRANQRLLVAIRGIHRASRGRYGAPMCMPNCTRRASGVGAIGSRA